MFGLLYAAAMGIGCLVSGTKCFIQNEQAKERGRLRDVGEEIPMGIYIDRKGCERLLSTNELITVEYNDKGDQIIRSIDPCSKSYGMIRNISEEKRELEFQKAKANSNGNTVMNTYQRIEIASKDSERYPTGFQYRDFETGERYVIRKLMIGEYDRKTEKIIVFENEGYSDYQSYRFAKKRQNEFPKQTIDARFYMNITTGKLVRMTDGQKRDNVQWKETKKDKYIPDDIALKFINNFNQQQNKEGWIRIPHFLVGSDDMRFLNNYKFCNYNDISSDY